jgi:hypothetical protein
LLEGLEGSDVIATNPEADYERYWLHDGRLVITDAPHQRRTSIEPEVFPVRMRRIMNGMMASTLLQRQFLRLCRAVSECRHLFGTNA